MVDGAREEWALGQRKARLPQLFPPGHGGGQVHLRNSTAPTLHRARVGVETRGGLWGSHLHLWPEAAFFPDVGTGNRAPLTRMRLQAPQQLSLAVPVLNSSSRDHSLGLTNITS